jgi:hypothetical protein
MALRVVAADGGGALVTLEKAEGCHAGLRKTLAAAKATHSGDLGSLREKVARWPYVLLTLAAVQSQTFETAFCSQCFARFGDRPEVWEIHDLTACKAKKASVPDVHSGTKAVHGE